MDLQYQVTEDDFRLAQDLAAKAFKSTMPESLPLRLTRHAFSACVCLSVLAIIALHRRFEDDVLSNLAWICTPAAAAFIVLLARERLRRREVFAFQRRITGPFLLDQRLHLGEDGLQFENRHGRVCMVWSSIRGVESHPDHVAITLYPLSVAVVPLRVFASPAEREEFKAALRARLRP